MLGCQSQSRILHCLLSIDTIPMKLSRLFSGERLMASVTHEQVFVGPGLSPFKRVVTIIGVIGVTALVLWIAIHEGISAVGSTIAAVLFILGFAYYLRLVAP